MNDTLSKEEAKFLVDLLKSIGKNEELNHDLAQCLGLNDEEFNSLADSIWEKLSRK